MQDILFEWKLNPTTWAYLSALMTIGIYFKFSRFWSVRNLDLVALIALSPGLLMLYHGHVKHLPGLVQGGYVWLFAISGFFLVRMLLDTVMVRRPLLDPNLSVGGLTFTGAALLVFLMANVVTNPQERLENILAQPQAQTTPQPGYALFYSFAGLSNQALIPADETQPATRRLDLTIATNRTAAILAHLAVVIGIVLIGYRHFGSVQTGMAVAALYLLLFYTSQMTGEVDHVVPSALLIWAVQSYRRPAMAGILLGLAAGVIFYPLFLLPLWCGFYWRRGLARFAAGVAAALLVLVLTLALTSDNLEAFAAQLKQMFGWTSLMQNNLTGFWQYHEPAFRIPVLAAFVALCGSLALWPAQKNLGTLLSCSAAVMVGAQFWHAPLGGTYMAWYLPLLLLTVFRPNLEDRVAPSAVREVRFRWRSPTT